MKLNLSALFDRSKMEEEIRDKLVDLLDYINNLSSQVQNLFNNGITFKDNVNCTIKEVELITNSPILVTLQKQIIGGFIIDSDVTLTHHSIIRTNSGIQVTAYSSSSQKANVKFIFLH